MNIEQLRKILDEDPELARALAESLAPDHGGAVAPDRSVVTGDDGVAVGGDVHGDVIIAAPIDRESPEGPRTAYLERVREQTRHFSLIGVDPSVKGRAADARLRLDAVYTGLMARTPRAGERPGAASARSGRERPLSALEQLDRHPRLVLLGDPGSGKSTFVNFVALCLAGEHLGDEQVNLARLTAPLPGGDEEKSQPWKSGRPVPVRIVLRDFAARRLGADAPAPGGGLWDFIDEDLRGANLGDAAPVLRRELREQEGLLLLDGLDEVPDAERQRERLRGAVEDFEESFPNCRIAVTSRVYAYQNQAWRLPGFAEVVLAPFGEGQIRYFVDRWYAHFASLQAMSADEAQGRAELLKRAIFASDQLRFLAERPLLLTLMASLHAWRGGSLPGRREQLYADTVDLLLDVWERQRVMRDPGGRTILIQPSLAEYLETDQEKVRETLEELAWDAHRQQPDLRGTADLDEGDVVKRLMRLRGDRPGRNPADLMDYLSQRAGILEPRGVGVYTFPHRTFQEYLAARHVTGGRFDEDQIAELGRTEPGRWREVVLLAAAKMTRGAVSGLWHLVDALCPRESADGEAGEADEWGALLAAQALVESAKLEQLSPRQQKYLDRVRHWLVRLLGSTRLPAVERVAAGDHLARLGDPRFDADRWFLPGGPSLGFLEVPGGPFRMGSDDVDELAYDDEKPPHQVDLPTFYMARFPVTVQQFRMFVHDSGYEIGNPDCLKELPHQPVVRVSWDEALAYCEWLNGKLRTWARDQSGELWRAVAQGRLKATLPSEAEWEKAARGTQGRIYPWGDEADLEKANHSPTDLGRLSAVGCFARGVGPYGCEEMSGNVLEWTRTLWSEYPHHTEDGRDDVPDASKDRLRVLRGGSAWNSRGDVRAAYRLWDDPCVRNGSVGFRVGLFPISSEL